MAENNTVTIKTDSGNSRGFSLKPPYDQLSIRKAWNDWIEEKERKFHVFFYYKQLKAEWMP